MNIFSKKIILIIFVLIMVNIVLSAYWLIMGDIHYDVDVSRDFLVINDIVANHRLTLLGPRSGAIPGIFHGPLWFYINLPVFMIGGGNPLTIGWFWFVLSVIFLWLIFWIARKIFDFRVALFSVLLFSANSIINPLIGLKNFYNPYGAVFLTPIFFFLFYRYITVLKVKYLISALFVLGLIIQFQMAFGIPIFIAVTIFLGFLLNKKKKITHLFSYFILSIPLSTFILFDIRHDWLQLNSVMQFINNQKSPQNLFNVFAGRIHSLVFDCFGQLIADKNWLTILYTIFFLLMFVISVRKIQALQKTAYFLFAYFFLAFWIISLFYSGGVGNYFWPFLPLLVIIFCSYEKVIKKEVFIPVFLVIYLINLYAGVSAILDFKSDINKRGPHSWAFNLQVAEEIYKDAKGNFGYFNFSPDRFAYQQRYAMIYAGKTFPQIVAFSSTKKPLTYLIEVDPPKDRLELNGTSWRISDVKIDRKPDETFRWDFIQVEKYLLSDDEIKKAPNPYLLDSVFIR